MRRVVLFLLCVVMGLTHLAAQSRVITGKVTDGAANPLAGATIMAVGTSVSTASDASGSFSISVPASARQLEVSYVGFVKQTIAIGSANSVTVKLQGNNESLSEVVVVAYGQQQKKAVTGAVSTVSAEKIGRQQVVSVGQALQGLASGVLVINSTGQPGDNPQIRIRGIGSVNASASPLIVVDGVPYDANLSNINPNDIESMNVLKDATATALYGSRAANGVILITTKTGKRGQDAQIGAYSTYGVSARAVKEYPFVSSEQYMKLAWEALKNQGTDINNANPGQYASDRLISTLKYNPYGSNYPKPIDASGNLVPGATLLWDTDWSKEIQNSSITRKNVGLNVAGGSEKVRYFFSGDYLNQDGYVIKSNFKRISSRLNLDADLRNWLTVGIKTAVSSSNQNYPDQAGSAFRNAVQFGRIMSSIYPLYMRDEQGNLLLDAKGNPQYDFGGPMTGRAVNVSRPVAANTNAVAIQNLDKTLNERLLTSLNTYGEIKLAKDLKFRSSFGIDRYTFTSSTYQNPIYGDAASVGGRVGKQRTLTSSWTWNNMLNYQKSFGDHW
jgi:TonB-linked SusC/RagA family outer membrane protein